jgi:hypothetical protein
MGEAEQAAIHQAWPKRHGISSGAAWTALASGVLIAIACVLAMAVHTAFLAVSLGPIIYEYMERPLARASSPRSTLVANAVALLVGFSLLSLFGLRHAPSTIQEGVTLARLGAVVCALAITGGLVVLLGAVHPPAGSTLLVVMLGILRESAQLGVMYASIVIVTVAAWVLNRIAGIDVPMWSSPKPGPYAER